MAVYWMTFRLERDASYSDRYNALMEAVGSACTQWWIEPTSFVLFRSDESLDALASMVKSTINVRKDVALIGMTETKGARVVGTIADQDLFGLYPDAKKL